MIAEAGLFCRLNLYEAEYCSMKKTVTIDFESNKIISEQDGQKEIYDLATWDGFRVVTDSWLYCGFANKYSYCFTWLGRPIIQIPADMIRVQEVIYQLRPDVIIETGVAHGGSLVFYASLCRLFGKGRVVGVDIEIRPANRKALEEHLLYDLITLIEGDAIAANTIQEVKAQVKEGEKIMLVLDSCHTKEHVLAELNAYASLVSVGSYILVADGIMPNLVGAPGSKEEWSWDNPLEAAIEFVDKNPDFIFEEPPFLFNEGNVMERITYWKKGFIKRVSNTQMSKGTAK